MTPIIEFIDLFLHLSEHLKLIIETYGAWTYALLFIIIFCETGLVITPFLPGDSLLFAAGALAALGNFELSYLFMLLIAAAVSGDTVNYGLGHYIGARAFEGRIPLVKQAHLVRTQHFYEKYGGKAIIIARFIPIIRTFAPFVAGIARMPFRKFLICNITGGLIWVLLLVSVGYFFGNLPIVQQNFSLVVVVIIFISILPLVYELVKNRAAALRDTP